MSRRTRRTLFLFGFALLIGLAAGSRALAALSPDPASAAMAEASRRSSYSFSADITQVSVPTSVLGNVGRTSRVDQVHISGESDLRAERLDLRMWARDGSAALPESGLQIQVADGRTLAREGAGPWQEIGDVTGAMAPQGDMLAYLSAMRDLHVIGEERRADLHYTRYAFTLDGPALADYLKQQLEQSLRDQGALPPGLELSAADHFVDAEGEGELWITAEGLPLRQILDIRFPPQADERLGARIDVTFADFGPPLGLNLDLTGMLNVLLAGMFGLGGLFFLLAARRSTRVAAALAITLIVTLVGGPFLSSLRVRSFLDVQAARAAEQQAQSEESEMLRTLRALQSAPDFDPQADPFAVPAPAVQIDDSARAMTAPQAIPDDGTDTDGDGLRDFAEAQIGTSSSSADADANGIPDGRDSDGDLVDDKREIDGFNYNGRLWRGDPLSRDSNSDGIADTQELLADADNNGIPDDSDGDGTPDAFDSDNDGDGVPDRLDLSPFSSARPDGSGSFFGENQPLALTLRSISANRTALLDLQLRPSNPDRLWYAMSVLDWPADEQAQVQDGDGATYADIAAAEGRTPEPAEYQGDMRLIPMLEIRVPTGTPLPPQAQLTAYNVVVNAMEDGSRVMYAPVNVINDTDTGARVAFNVRIPYSAGNWPAPQQARLVWVVQMLADICADGADGRCNEYEQLNQAQVLQTYYDDWFLTGASIREDHGTTIAAIYEDPAASAETNLRNDDTLWLLAHGLDNAFLGGRDQDANGQRDLTITTMQQRFDRLSNGGVSEEQRWGLENLLRVEPKSYATFDEAVITTAMTTTNQLLQNTFSSRWSANDAVPIMPLILFAREERFRSQSLDSAGNGYVSFAGGNLSFDLQPSGTAASPLLTQVGLNWSAYCGQAAAGNTVDWSACAVEDYWSELARRFAATMAQPGDTAVMAEGRMTLAQLYFLSLQQGVSRIVESDGQIQAPGYVPLADNATLALVRGVRNGSAAAISGLLNLTIMSRFDDAGSTLSYLGRLLKEMRGGTLGQAVIGIGKTLIDKLGYKAGMTVIGLAVTAIVAALAVGAYFLVKYYLAGELGAKIVVTILISTITLILSIILPIITVVQWVQALQAAGIGTLNALRTVLSASSTIVGTSQAAGVIGAVVGALVVWGFFIYAMVTSSTTPFSPEFNRAFAEAIAATIYLIILAVLSATVVGLIIVGVIALIDAVLTAICELGVDELRTVPGLDGACFTLGTTATKGIAKLIYSFDVMVDTERDELITTGAPDVQLAQPNRGYVAGNLLRVQLPITTTVVHKSPKPEDWMHIAPYLWLFSRDNLRSSTFEYQLSPAEAELSVGRNEMNSAWTVEEDRLFGFEVGGVDFGKTMFRAQAPSDHGALSGVVLPAGLNQPIDFFLNIGYAIPAYECWTIPNPVPPFTPPAVPVCYTRTVDGNSSAEIENQIRLDIFPNTLDGFVAKIEDGNGGWKLAWDAQFTTLADADNDGLLSTSVGGIDPDDAQWDSDGDGLSDAFELDRRAAGLSISPVNWDTDGDGLTDAQEVQFGTHPVRADSDNDGLADNIEQYHEVYAFNGQTRRAEPTGVWAGGWNVQVVGSQPYSLRVSSDPTLADGDGDGIGDQAERQFALNATPANRLDSDGLPYHPRIANLNPLAVHVAVNDVDRIVRPGQSLIVTTTMDVASSLVDLGALELDVNRGIFGQFPFLASLDFNPATRIVNQQGMQVAPGASNGETTITARAKVRLEGSSGPELSWRTPTVGAQGTFSGKSVRWATVAASTPDRQDNYVIAGHATDNSNFANADWDPQRRGDIMAYTQPGGQSGALEVDRTDTSALFGSTGARSVCDDQGNCMIVWSQYNNCTNLTINSISVSSNSDEGNGADLAVYFRRDPDFRLPSEPVLELIFAEEGIGTGVTRGINLNRTLCEGGTFEIWEFDDWAAVDGDPNGDSRITKVDDVLVLAANPGVRDLGYGGFVIDGTVSGNFRITSPNRHLFDVVATMTNADLSIVRPAKSLSAQDDLNTQDWGPAAASDGRAFLVAWERTNANFSLATTMEHRIVVRLFDPTLNALISEVVLPLELTRDTGSYQPRPFLPLSVAWIGSAYRVIWTTPAGLLRRADFTSQGALISNSIVTLDDKAIGIPSIAYDPLSGSSIVVYRNTNGEVIGRISPSRTIDNAAFTIAASGIGPQAAYHPTARAWLVSWNDPSTGNRRSFYRLIAADGSNPSSLSTQQISWPNTTTNSSSTGLACPAITSAPVMDYTFEELPGAQSFADRSGYNGSSAKSDIFVPYAGVNGAPNAPLSDFALRFAINSQGLQLNAGSAVTPPSSMSVAFWMKTTQTDGNTGATWTSSNPIVTHNDFSIGMAGGSLLLGTRNGGRALSTGSLADDQWHFVVGTISGDTTRLYVNGQLQREINGQSLSANPLSLRLGRNNAGFQYRGDIDHMQVFPTVLSAAAVQALYQRTNQSYCMATMPAGTTLNNAFLRLDRNDLRGGLITQSAGVTVRIDADLPTAAITSLNDGDILRGENGGLTVIIGGNASDPSSEVAAVEVNVNGGGFVRAEGAASWSYALTLGEGTHTLAVRAIDAVGNVGAASGPITVQVDATAPEATFAPELSAAAQPAQRTAAGTWAIALSGAASDPAPGSGIDLKSLRVSLQNSADDPNAVEGAGAQAALLNGNTWQASYLLPAELSDPSGTFTATLSLADLAGNRREVAARITIDAAGPQVTVNPDLRDLTVISETITLGGTLSDPSQVVSGSLSFTPIEQVAAYSDTLALYLFDEPAGAAYFADRSQHRHNLSCLHGCEGAGANGRIDAAMNFGFETRLRSAPGALNFTPEQSFTLATWIRTGDSDGPIMQGEGVGPGDLNGSYGLWLAAGKPVLRVGASVLTGTFTLNNNQWQFLAAVIDRSSGEAILYQNGLEAARSTLNAPNELGRGPLTFGGGYEGMIDHAAIIGAALNPAQLQAVRAVAETARLPLVISPANAINTTWSIPVPAELEGQYQLDLRATDSLGNRSDLNNLRRFVIDTAPPRIGAEAFATGDSYSDDTGKRIVEVEYSYSATDRHLDETSFSGPCNAVPKRSFSDTSALESLFPDLTVRSGLEITCRIWEPEAKINTTVSACDIYGNCSSVEVKRFVPKPTANQPAAGEPLALIVNPTGGQVVAADDSLQIEIAATAAAGLAEIRVTLDGNNVGNIDLRNGAALTTTVQSLAIAAPAEGTHTLAALAVDRNGVVQGSAVPVSFEVDRAAPSVSLEGETLTADDSLATGSGMLRLNGTAGDSLGLAAVQVSVDNGPFVDATLFADGSWSTVRWFGWDAEGNNYRLVVRAIDRAGRQNDLTRDVTVDISEPPLIDTAITARPDAASKQTTATFAFSGSAPAGQSITGFRCRIDDGAFTPCSSPISYSGLSNGRHSFAVYALDGAGNTDATPATYTWTVDAEYSLYLPWIAR